MRNNFLVRRCAMTLLNIKPKNMMTTLCANLQNNLAVELCESRGMFIV